MEKLEELAKQAEEDLKVVKSVEYGNTQEDVNTVNAVKAQLEEMYNSLTNNKDERFEKLDKDFAKYTKFHDFLQDFVNKNDVTDNDLTSTIKEQIPVLEKACADITKAKSDYEIKLTVVKTVLDYFQFVENKEDGKCYVEQFVIDFARLMLA